jgi:hypothetical protein
MFSSVSHWTSIDNHMALLFLIFFATLKVFTCKKSHHWPKILDIKKLSSFKPNPKQMTNRRFPPQTINKGYSLSPPFQFPPHFVHNAIEGVIHESFEFFIIFTTNLWHNLLHSPLSLQRNENYEAQWYASRTFLSSAS